MIDYTDVYHGLNPSVADHVLAAQAEGRMFAILWREGDPAPTHTAFDRRGRRREVRCPYTLEKRWLSRDPRPDTDDFACVEYGPEMNPLTASEARNFVRAAKAGRSMFKAGTIAP